MRKYACIILLFVLFFAGQSSGQVSALEINPLREKMFTPYLATRHGGAEGLAKFKEENRYLYLKELWYFTESFFVQRNQFSSGIELNEEIIDITRFEANRKPHEDVYLQLPGFKDALVLKAADKLLYKPDYH
mgnify:FL=1